MLMRCYEGTRNVRMLMTGRGEQAHVGVALLSGFGGANTAKEGEKTAIRIRPSDTISSLRERIWKMMYSSYQIMQHDDDTDLRSSPSSCRYLQRAGPDQLAPQRCPCFPNSSFCG